MRLVHLSRPRSLARVGASGGAPVGGASGRPIPAAELPKEVSFPSLTLPYLNPVEWRPGWRRARRGRARR